MVQYKKKKKILNSKGKFMKKKEIKS